MYAFIMYASYADICVRNVGKRMTKLELYNEIIVTIIHKCTHNEAQCPEHISALVHFTRIYKYMYIIMSA